MMKRGRLTSNITQEISNSSYTVDQIGTIAQGFTSNSGENRGLNSDRVSTMINSNRDLPVFGGNQNIDTTSTVGT